MAQYKIKEGQTILDVSNQLYTEIDSIKTILLNNSNIDVNSMNENEIINYSAVTNYITNQIDINNYSFENRDNVVYKLNETFELSQGNYNLSSNYPNYVNKGYYKISPSNEYGFIIENTNIIIFDGYILELYIEEF